MRFMGFAGQGFMVVWALALGLSTMYGAELAAWSVKTPASSKGITLAGGEPQAPRTAMINKEMVSELRPESDYFKRASYHFRIDKPLQGPVWLTLGFLDKGYGLISLSFEAKGVSQAEARTPVIVNSGKIRHAAFRMNGTLQGVMKITGMRYLQSVQVSDTEPRIEPLPEIKPAFTLKRPMDLVITAGADAPTVEGLPGALAYLRQNLPLMKALGFNGIESYVKWNFVERSPGKFDWSYYDAIVAEVERHGMKWFPLLIVGSAYALPDWFYESGDNVPYVCLEHGKAIEIPTIFAGTQDKYVIRFLNEFGKHYGNNPSLLGIRLGPSGNYGEAQYPATGAWGYKGRPLHTHIGYWVGDPAANQDFRRWLKAKYPDIGALNRSWDASYKSFDDVKTFLPVTANNTRMRVDFSTWYLDAMSLWCEKWAIWAREAMPKTSIYQSSGGWGAVEIGTDYAAHTKTMARLGGGIRMTNENDSYLNNFGNTRLAASAARFYGAKWGTEPAGFSSMRGVVNRIYNAIANDAEHLFYYDGNIIGNDQGIDAWLKFAPLLDQRGKPRAEIAVVFSDTANKMRDDTLRYLRASAYLQRVHAMREAADFDVVSEQMIADGALDRYKAVIMVWGNTMEKAALDKLGEWVERGGTVFFPDRELTREGLLQDLSGDTSIYRRWREGKTGKGRAMLFDQQTEPFTAYVRFVRNALAKLDTLSPEVRAAVGMTKPDGTYWTVMEDGRLALLSYDDAPAVVRIGAKPPLTMAPYTIWMEGGKAKTPVR